MKDFGSSTVCFCPNNSATNFFLMFFFWHSHVESSKVPSSKVFLKKKAQGTHGFEAFFFDFPGAPGTMAQPQWIWREAKSPNFFRMFSTFNPHNVSRCLGYMQSYDKACSRSSDPGTWLRCFPRCAIPMEKERVNLRLLQS